MLSRFKVTLFVAVGLSMVLGLVGCCPQDSETVLYSVQMTPCVAQDPIYAPKDGQHFIAFINVNNAVSPETMKALALTVRDLLPIHQVCYTAQADKLEAALLDGFTPDTNAVVCVYLTRNPTADQPVTFTQRVNQWCIVPMNGLDADTPAAELLQKRQVKQALKGLAFATGAGICVDPHCVMWGEALTDLKKFDKTSASFGPTVYFPMSSYFGTIPNLFIEF